MTTFGQPSVEFDVETSGLQWYAPDQGPFMAQFLGADDEPTFDNTGVYDLDLPFDRRCTDQWLRDVATFQWGFRAHNAKFDLHMLKAAGFELPPDRLWHDSELLAKLVDERSSAALKARHDAVFGGGRDLQDQVFGLIKSMNADYRKEAKAEGKEMRYANFETVYAAEPELMVEYGANDCILQRRLSNHLERIIARDPKLVELYELERATMVALFWAEDRGVPIDREAMVRLELALLDDFERLEARCKALAGIDTFNPGSPKQIVEALERRGVDTNRLDKTKGGSRSTDNENLSGLNDELAETLLEWRGVEKVLTTYAKPALHRTLETGKLPGWRAPYLTDEDRIHAEFRTWGARTGRMSCATPNLQNIPRDDLRIRYAWRAEPGRRLVTADMDQIEARLLAAYAGEGRLLSAFRNGDDIHSLTARMMGLGDFERAGGHVETARQRGKKFKYSKMYGAGIRSLKKSFHTDDDGARRMIALYNEAYPEVAALQSRVAYTLAENGYVRTKWGRKQRRDDVPWDVSYKYINYLIQGTAADMIKQATVKVHEAGVPIVAVVHDEIVADVDEADAPEAARVIEEALTDFPAITDYVPLDAESTIVERWSDAKTPGYTPDYMER